MCSLPTMKFKAAAAPGWVGGTCALGVGVGLAVFSRGGPLSFSLCTYSVRMMKNCPVEAVISFKTFRATAGAALKLTSTTLRSINSGAGVPPGFAGVRAGATLRPRVGAADGVGVGEAPCSSGNGAR